METMHKEEAMETGSHVDNGTAKDKSTTDEWDPWDPPYPPYVPSTDKSYSEWFRQRNAFLSTSRRTNIIIPDRTPQVENYDFYRIYPRLLPILKKDSVRRFLRFFEERGDLMTWGFIITPETFNHMIVENALRCAKVALEGKAPELDGFCANPNCMNQYGYFPLHEAAERFSVDMIKLLLHHGASTNLRTAGGLVIENLLPLHVAVEDACLHKYLEDNLLPNQGHPDYPTKADANYIYKLIHLLCLPEMKIFLDTTRLLAEYTNNLVDEIWNYIKDGKLVQTAVLLLAAQAHIRMASSCKRNGNSLVDGFATIVTRIAGHSMTLKLEMGQNEKEQQHLEAKCKLMSPALLLVNIIAQAGKALDSYIQTHQEVSQAEVLERVSSILKAHGFFPTGEGISTGNLCPYKWWPLPNGELPVKHGNAAAEMPYPYPADRKAARNKLHRRWEREYTWRSFFPYWRSVLAYRFPLKVYPAHAQQDVMRRPNFDHIHNSGGNSIGKLSVQIPYDNGRLLARMIRPVTSNHQSRRLFGTVALTLLKVVKNA